MKNILDLIKSNPLVAASAIVSVLGFVLIGYIYFVSAPSQSADNSETLKEQQQRQKTLMNVSVPLPNEDPNAPADMEPVVINQKVINEVGAVYSRIQDDYEDILLKATEKNMTNHAGWLLGGGNIWPDANPQVAFDYYVAAASDYKTHFKALFDVQSNGNAWNMPVMSAGSPPTPEELQDLLALSAFEYVSSVGAQSANDLSQSQAEQLFAEQRMTLMNALNQRARRINLYVQLPPEEDRFAPKETDDPSGADAAPLSGGFAVGGPARRTGGQGVEAAEYPFIIQPWAFSDQPPTPDQLWEGQVQLWIMRDLMIAISEMNNVGKVVKEIGPDGTIRDIGASVVNSPIKRLLSLKTLPGYVGLHNTGAALGGAKKDAATGGPTTANNELFGVPFTPTTGVGQGNVTQPSVYPAPPLELAPKESTARAVEHFGITPTGRVSNATFDVRHTQLIIDIEAVALPAFLETVREVNFMTVIKAEITDLDEYELLQEGYVYGHNDVVRANLVIESLWFRNWTQDLMPKIVKEKLLIIKPEVSELEQEYQEF